MARLVKYEHIERENDINNCAEQLENFDHWFSEAVAHELTTKQLNIVLHHAFELAGKPWPWPGIE